MSVTGPFLNPGAYLTFEGRAFYVAGGRQPVAFSVMVGENPPTIVDGYAQWQALARPLNRALTVFQGYNPMALKVEVRFVQFLSDGSWATDDKSGIANEQLISNLEWLAGAYYAHGLTNVDGPSPIVYVQSDSPQDHQSDLIPPAARGRAWVISEGVQWGKSYRNPSGHRIWQDATFTLLEYLSFNKPPAVGNKAAGGYFTVTSHRNTALLIAQAPSTQSPPAYAEGLANRIVASPKNKKVFGNSKNVYKKLRVGTKVWVPAHAG